MSRAVGGAGVNERKKGKRSAHSQAGQASLRRGLSPRVCARTVSRPLTSGVSLGSAGSRTGSVAMILPTSSAYVCDWKGAQPKSISCRMAPTLHRSALGDLGGG